MFTSSPNLVLKTASLFDSFSNPPKGITSLGLAAGISSSSLIFAPPSGASLEREGSPRRAGGLLTPLTVYLGSALGDFSVILAGSGHAAGVQYILYGA